MAGLVPGSQLIRSREARIAIETRTDMAQEVEEIYRLDLRLQVHQVDPCHLSEGDEDTEHEEDGA